MTKQRLLVLRNETTAHILPEGASVLPLGTVVKDLKKSIKYIPSLKCFNEGSDWEVTEEHIDPAKVGISDVNEQLFYICKRHLSDLLSEQGYNLV